MRTNATTRRAGRALPAVATLALALAPAMASAADSCPIPIDDVKAAVESFASKVGSEDSGASKDFSSATSSTYANNYFANWDSLNKAASDATKYVTKGYDLAKYTGALPEDTWQKAMPPTVTLSMKNAMDLAEAAADEDNTKLDLAELRCDQNTEDAALGAALDQIDSKTVDKFKAAKKTACRLVHFAADLQEKKRQLDKIRTNGYPLFHISKKDKKDFAGHTRTIQLRADLRMYPEYPGDAKDQKFLLGDLESINLSYNSYFKWSDDNWTPLNIIQYLKSESDEKDEVCYPKLKLSSSVQAATCVRVSNISTESIKLKVRGKFWYKGENHAVNLGEYTIPAPFGYLADVSDMKEKKMQDLKSKAVKRVSSLLGDYGDMIEKAHQWKESCSG